MPHLSLSIVIPTVNRYPNLVNTIKDLSNQLLQDYEILIVDQTKDFQKIQGDKLRYFHLKEPSASRARNLGILKAESEIILFLDDDMIIQNKHFLLEHLKHYANPNIHGVCGLVLNEGNEEDERKIREHENRILGSTFFPKHENEELLVSGGISCNMSVRKSSAMAIGGMDERFVRGAYREETDFCFRFTKRYGHMIFDPRAYAVHLGNSEGGSRQWQNKIMHGAHHMFGGWYLMFRHLGSKLWLGYSYHMLRRFVLHKKLLLHFYLLPYALATLIVSFCKALYFSTREPILLDSESFE